MQPPSLSERPPTKLDGMGGDAWGLVLRPSGDLDLATVESFRASVDDALAQQPPALVVDLADVDFLDSSALGVLAVALKAQRTRNAAIAVVNPKAIVKRALDVVGLAVLLDVSDIPDALLT